jgi:glutathione S-transferase
MHARPSFASIIARDRAMIDAMGGPVQRAVLAG